MKTDKKKRGCGTQGNRKLEYYDYLYSEKLFMIMYDNTAFFLNLCNCQFEDKLFKINGVMVVEVLQVENVMHEALQ